MAIAGQNYNYKAVAASQTTAPICGEGGYIARIAVACPSSTPGAWSLNEGSTAIFSVPAGAGDGTKPYTVELGIFAKTAGGFTITTGASVSVIVSGNFTPTSDE